MTLQKAAAIALTLALCVLGGCKPPQTDITAIVGATLFDPPDQLRPYHVVIVRGASISAIGPQQTTPIPAAAVKINGIGKVLMGTRRQLLTPGAAADLVVGTGDPIAGSFRTEREMRGGKWVEASR